MKSTGTVRKMDNLGRFVIPMATRRMFGMEVNDPIEIFIDGELIVLQKYVSYGTCPITGENSARNIQLADGKMVLSPEGAKQLLAELEKYLEKV
ncbi:TPA: AbrB/MazE/SpoVT family DNA-binding domain-containing protein [Bacillus cereus]|nr:AbrB/MazE/SpoVT family DNA-binding domain-containing protein [Bacillus cereus]